MKITLKDIKLADQPLTMFVEQQIPIKLAYTLGKLVRLMHQELQHIESARVKLVKQYGTEDEEAKTIEVASENMQKFNDDWTQLLDTEVDIDFEPLSTTVLDNVNINMTPLDMSFLRVFFKEE